MKTISGECISTKQISLSKSSKILSKFVTAENGASQVISAYLYRASTSFNELNQLLKELKSSHTRQKHKRHRTENGDKYDEKSTQTFVKFSQEPDGCSGHHGGNLGESEKHKKNKRNQQELESRAQNEIESGRVQGDEAERNTGVEERKKQKRVKNEKKDKEGTFNFSSSKGEVENPKVESIMGSGRQKEIGKEAMQ